ncbi:MAG: hypothetical protein STSR0008_11480 [Ignavibacterium sp.]
MKVNTYETAIIINGSLEDTQIEKTIEKVKNILAQHNCKIIDIENWNRKRLAYMINKQKIGYYVFFRFEAPSDFIINLERLLKLDETILRFLTIKLEKNALEYIQEHKVSTPEEKLNIPEFEVLETNVDIESFPELDSLEEDSDIEMKND